MLSIIHSSTSLKIAWLALWHKLLVKHTGEANPQVYGLLGQHSLDLPMGSHGTTTGNIFSINWWLPLVV